MSLLLSAKAAVMASKPPSPINKPIAKFMGDLLVLPGGLFRLMKARNQPNSIAATSRASPSIWDCG
jgi:hypothetical protein